MTKELRAIKLQAQCKTALGLLDAARTLVEKAEAEAPGAGIRTGCDFIKRHIQKTQETLLKVHDGKVP